MDQKEFESRGREVEYLDEDGEKVAALLRSLPRVQAPANFDFHLNARIARGQSPRATLIPFFKIAAPLGLVLLVTVAFLFYGSMPSNTDVAAVEAPVADSRSSASPPQTESFAPQPAPPVAQNPDPVVTQAPTAKSNPLRTIPASTRRPVDQRPIAPPRDGSVDLTQKTANVINPPGTDPRTAADISVREVLQMLGVTAEFSDGGWKVQSAAENSVAQRSGIKSNDVIEAVDGKPLTGTTNVKGDFGKVLRVRRDGKKIDVTLLNR